MASSCSVFVEGKPDQALVQSLLKYQEFDDAEVEIIGGGISKLKQVAPQIRRRHDSGTMVAAILDADDDLKASQRLFENEVSEHDIKIDRIFYLPDNRSNGCLENLLQDISLSEHAVVYDCFQQYERCLHRADASYRLPSLKGRVYAYCEAVGGVKEMKRRVSPVLAACQDIAFWNVAAAELEPLLKFLESLRTPS